MRSEELCEAAVCSAAVEAAEAAVRYNAARKAIMYLRETAKIREEEDGTPVIAQAGANAARDELKDATLDLDARVAHYETVKAEMGG